MKYKIIELEKKDEWIPKQKKGKGKSKITKEFRRQIVNEWMRKHGYENARDV